MFSWLFSREEDLEAAKLEKMFLESFRGLGEAGDWGILWRAAGGWSYSASSGMAGEVGLLGLMGALVFSLPPLALMANDSVDDLGMLLASAASGRGIQVGQPSGWAAW